MGNENSIQKFTEMSDEQLKKEIVKQGISEKEAAYLMVEMEKYKAKRQSKTSFSKENEIINNNQEESTLDVSSNASEDLIDLNEPAYLDLAVSSVQQHVPKRQPVIRRKQCNEPNRINTPTDKNKPKSRDTSGNKLANIKETQSDNQQSNKNFKNSEEIKNSASKIDNKKLIKSNTTTNIDISRKKKLLKSTDRNIYMDNCRYLIGADDLRSLLRKHNPLTGDKRFCKQRSSSVSGDMCDTLANFREKLIPDEKDEKKKQQTNKQAKNRDNNTAKPSVQNHQGDSSWPKLFHMAQMAQIESNNKSTFYVDHPDLINETMIGASMFYAKDTNLMHLKGLEKSSFYMQSPLLDRPSDRVKELLKIINSVPMNEKSSSERPCASASEPSSFKSSKKSPAITPVCFDECLQLLKNKKQLADCAKNIYHLKDDVTIDFTDVKPKANQLCKLVSSQSMLIAHLAVDSTGLNYLIKLASKNSFIYFNGSGSQVNVQLCSTSDEKSYELCVKDTVQTKLLHIIDIKSFNLAKKGRINCIDELRVVTKDFLEFGSECEVNAHIVQLISDRVCMFEKANIRFGRLFMCQTKTKCSLVGSIVSENDDGCLVITQNGFDDDNKLQDLNMAAVLKSKNVNLSMKSIFFTSQAHVEADVLNVVASSEYSDAAGVNVDVSSALSLFARQSVHLSGVYSCNEIYITCGGTVYLESTCRLTVSGKLVIIGDVVHLDCRVDNVAEMEIYANECFVKKDFSIAKFNVFHIECDHTKLSGSFGKCAKVFEESKTETVSKSLGATVIINGHEVCLTNLRLGNDVAILRVSGKSIRTANFICDRLYELHSSRCETYTDNKECNINVEKLILSADKLITLIGTYR